MTSVDAGTAPAPAPRADPDVPAAPAAPAVIGLRERKRLRTARDLSDAAIRLATAHGFDSVTADDIAAAADVSKTTFYRYFDSKEDALLGSPADKAARLRQALEARPARESTLSAVRNAMVDVVAGAEFDRDRSLALSRIIRSTPSLQARNLEHQAALEAVLTEFVLGRTGDRPDAALRARVVAAIIVATVRAAVGHWRDGNCEDDLHAVVGTALAMLAERRAGLTSTD